MIEENSKNSELQDSQRQKIINQLTLGIQNNVFNKYHSYQQRKYTQQSDFKGSMPASPYINPINKKMTNFVFEEMNGDEFDNQTDQDKWNKLQQIMKKLKFNTYIKKFLMLSRKKLYKLLNINQLSLINDQACYIDFEKQNKMNCKSIQEGQSYLYLNQTSKKEIAQWMIFNPNSFFLELWSFIKIFSIIICFFFYLASFAFSIHIKDILNPFIYYGCQFNLAVDIFIRLNTGIYLKGQLTLSRRLIVRQYKSSKLLYYDLIQAISFIIYSFLIFTNLTPTFCQQLFLLPIVFKYQDLNNMLLKMKNKFIQKKQAQKVFELIDLIKNILFISHIFSCIWILTAKIYSPINQLYSFKTDTQNISNQQNYATWIDEIGIQNESWTIQYLYSYYFIIVTMITVGYGDVRPTNPLEVGVCIVLMMTCCLVFGFTINQIGYIFQDMYLKEKNILLKKCIISNYMQKKEINSNTQNQVFEYLEYVWREELDEHQQEANAILSQLSNNLKQQIQLESNKLILRENRILKDNFSSQILTEIIPFIQEQNCTPGEVIIDEQIGNIESYLFFVQQGEVEIYRNCKQTQAQTKNIQQQPIVSIKKVSQGENFGQKPFFTGQKENLSVKSLNFSTLLKIKRIDFLNIIKQHQSDFEKFCMIKDKIIYSGFYAQLNDQCSSCSERNHTEIQCPILHYIPQKFKILQQNQVNIPHQQRETMFQRRKNKKSTFEELENNVYRGLQFIEDKIEELDQYEIDYFEYSLFQNNQLTYSDLEQYQEKLLYYSQKLKPTNQKNNNSSEEKENSRNMKSRLSTFISNRLIKQQSFEDENVQESSKSIQNKNDSENETDQEQDKFRKKLHKKFMNTVSVMYQSSKLLQEYDELSEHNHFPKQNQGIIQRSSILNPSFKDIQLQEKYFKNQKASDQSSNTKNGIESHSIQPFSQKQVIDTFFNTDFDVFQGKFESLQNFKYYFPQQNSKEVLNKLNETLINQVNAKGIIMKSFFRNENGTNNFKRRNNLYTFMKKKVNDSSHQITQTIDLSYSNQQNLNLNANLDFDAKQTPNLSIANSFTKQKSQSIELENQQSISKIQSSQNQKFYSGSAANDITTAILNHSIKVDFEIPEFEDEQQNLKIIPFITYPKRSYFFDCNN